MNRFEWRRVLTVRFAVVERKNQRKSSRTHTSICSQTYRRTLLPSRCILFFFVSAKGALLTHHILGYQTRKGYVNSPCPRLLIQSSVSFPRVDELVLTAAKARIMHIP